MNLKSKLQRMLQIVEDAERVGALADIERDILLAELREAYTELKFGETDNERCAAEESVEESVEELPIIPIIPIVPITPMTEEPTESAESVDEEESDEPEVEVELIFNEEDDDDEEPTEEEPVVESGKEAEVEVEVEVATGAEVEIVETEEKVEKTEEIVEVSQSPIINSQSPKRSALLSLYEDAPAPVLGEQFHEAPSVADTIACPKGVAESAPVASLRETIGLADKFMLIRELFDGEAEAYDKAIEVLDKQPSFDDCIIYIAENYTWSPNSAATKFLMELLQRKYN
ncbi:MAG: hypothetical protein J6Q01_06085 [Alistipes sp.]|nr:hypothetical protein [Alistipes sp.]